jgi:hypothetical protein
MNRRASARRICDVGLRKRFRLRVRNDQENVVQRFSEENSKPKPLTKRNRRPVPLATTGPGAQG